MLMNFNFVRDTENIGPMLTTFSQSAVSVNSKCLGDSFKPISIFLKELKIPMCCKICLAFDEFQTCKGCNCCTVSDANHRMQGCAVTSP